MKHLMFILIAVGMFCNAFNHIVLREQVVSLKTDNATHAEQLRQFEKIVMKYPIDHTRIESNVNLIGSKLFTNWEMASKLYAKRGK